MSLLQPIRERVFLLWYLVCAVVTVLFLSYFNRLVGSLISYGIRLYTWHYYRVYVEIHAFQFSPLAGRVFFKGIRYHGRNETILIHDGYVTWRYWLRRVQELDFRKPEVQRSKDDASSGAGHGEDGGIVSESDNKKNLELPCRVLLRCRGVEWFVYNRSPAYDTILRGMKDTGSPDEKGAKSEEDSGPFNQRSSSDHIEDQRIWSRFDQKDPNVSEEDANVDGKGLSPSSTRSSIRDRTKVHDQQGKAIPNLLSIFPVAIECSKAAIVMGNQNTRSILTAKFDSASGHIDARRSRLDQYKQTIEFDFVHPVIQFKHNRDYKDSQINEGARSCSDRDQESSPATRWYQKLDFRRGVHIVGSLLRDIVPYHRGSLESLTHPRPRSAQNSSVLGDNSGVYGHDRWLGLTRYLDEDDDFVEQERWKAVEYAQYPTIVDSPSITMNFYWDVPGIVPTSATSFSESPSQHAEDINGDAPPDWGIDLKVRGGVITYGPWADRQRTDLQAVFFPTMYKDALPATKLASGQPRVSTELKILIEIEEQTILRVPTREDSKDWKWKGHTSQSARNTKQKKKSNPKGKKSQEFNQGPEARHFAWLDIRILPDSTVNFAMDLLARVTGYRNHVTLDLRGIEISSSVNHGLLWKSQSQLISCNISNPLGWNSLRQWHVDIEDNNLELFLLRDHIFLLTDLISDWTSGPSGDFHTFVPFEYSLNLRFLDFKLYLNANDSNIIDNPSNENDNTFVVVWGQELAANLIFPLETFRPARNKVSFDIGAHDGGFKLLTPPWNTQHTFLSSTDVAALNDLNIDGSYNYFTTTSPSSTDTLILNVHGQSPRIDLYGFLIRYLMKIKDNYFGDDLHFRTLEEYQDQISKAEGQTSEELKSGQHTRLSNDLDVVLSVSAEQSCALLPAHLYSVTDNLRLEISSVRADLRITNYYMDLAISSSPIAISHTSKSDILEQESDEDSNTQVFVDGLEVSGHRLFGLPPTEPTYVCNWDFNIGSASGECSIEFLRCLVFAVRCFALSFDDAENALPPLNPPMIHDITFLRARIRPISVGLRVDDSAFLLTSQEVKLDYNDWAGPLFSDRLYLCIPDLTLVVADSRGASVEKSGPPYPQNTHAYAQLTIELNRVKRKLDFKADRHLQQNHVQLHDRRTGRVPWFIHEPDQMLPSEATARPAKVRVPAMPYPSMPEPVSTSYDLAADKTSLSKISEPGGSASTSSRNSSFLKQVSMKQRHVRRLGRQARTSKSKRENGLRFNSENTETPSPVQRHLAKDALTLDPRAPLNDHQQLGRPISRQGTSQHSFAFSSPYKRPYFRLLATIADTRDVPNLPENLSYDTTFSDSDALESLESLAPDEETEHSTFMMNLSKGIRAFCTPDALLLVTRLQEQFQTNDAVTLLDALQVDAMSDVMNANGKRERGSQINEFRLYAPFIGARFVSKTVSNVKAVTGRERYDLTIDNLAVTLRSSDKVHTSMQKSASHQLSLHVVLDQIICSAKESVEDSKADQAVITLSVYDPVFWAFQGTSSAEIQFRDLEVASASRKVDYISSLIEQTVVLSERLTERFTSISVARKSRLQLLVLLLTMEGDGIPDPTYLTGASYVLRSATNHLRTSDSWKMMSRLRYIHQCLPGRLKAKIHAQCIHKWASCPEDAASRVVGSFDHWRAWDLTHIRSSLLMQKVYGQLLHTSPQDSEATRPVMATVRAGCIRILVEPGPNQNEISIDRIVVGIALNQLSRPTNTTPSQDNSNMTNSDIQVHFVKIAVRLNWSLCELVENVMNTVQEHRRKASPKTNSHLPTPKSLTRGSCLHIAVSFDMSILNIDTINLKAISLCQDLKGSYISLQSSDSSRTPLMSLIINARAATSEVRSHTAMLTLYKLRRPSIFGSQDCEKHQIEPPWKFIGSGDEVSFQVLENPLEVIEIADRFLNDEVAHLSRWITSRHLKNLPHQSPPVAASTRTGLNKTHVALFLNSYMLSIAFLPSLTYEVRGMGVRSSIKAGLRGDFDIDIGFDLKDHSHVLKTRVKDIFHDLSTVDIPPINGRLTLDLAPDQKLVVFRALVERIVVNASAIHAILTAIKRPEITGLARSIRNEISTIQHDYRHIYNIEKPVTWSKPISRPILYDGYTTLAGLAVHASTANGTSGSEVAQLRFDMGRVKLKATNKDSEFRGPLIFSELEVQIYQIRIKLVHSNEDNPRSCGDVSVSILLKGTSKQNEAGRRIRSYQIRSSSLEVVIYTETASVIVAILGHLQNTLKTFDLSNEVRALRKLGRERFRKRVLDVPVADGDHASNDAASTALFSAMYSLEMTNIRASWKVGNTIPSSPGREAEDLVLSFDKIDLATIKDNAARLLIEAFQLQMAPASLAASSRSLNSALLPEVVFNVAYRSTTHDRRLAFQAVGKSLDLHLTSHFMLPASDLRRSIAIAVEQVRTATADWKAVATEHNGDKKSLLGNKKLASLLVDADFAGAVVYIKGRTIADPHSSALNAFHGGWLPQHGRYNQFTSEDAGSSSTTLRAPGIAFKTQYKNASTNEQSLNAEMKVDASSNILYPTIVPLIMEISSSVKEIVGEPAEQQNLKESKPAQPKFLEDQRLRTADPSAIFGNCKLNLGLRICRQEFSLSCQPIARVAATARFDDIYITVNTVQTHKYGQFFTISATFTRPQATVQHVYSRESTGSFEVDSVVVSLMNSKHVSGADGISAILKISPIKAQVNAKQLQDFLLFREIWVPPEVRQASSTPDPIPASEPQAFIVQRYQQIAAAGAFPLNAIISVAELDVQLDLGQSLGKSAFLVSRFWVSSKKSSDWEQNLCLGFNKVEVNSTGRMSGFVELQDFEVRTSIQWPVEKNARNRTPLVQASLRFDHLRVKAGFDHQAFLVADITTFEFLMYNVRNLEHAGRDRLFGILNGDKVHLFCTTDSTSQSLALYQAIQRLIQEKQAAYETSLRDIEKFLRRKSSVSPFTMRAAAKRQADTGEGTVGAPLRLQTEVVVTLKAVNMGAFPSTFFDNQIFKLEALDASARFAVVLDREKIHCTLGMTLGQLRIALSAITRANVPKTLGEVSVMDVVTAAIGSRGGTILKVPKLVATMQTWQSPESTSIDYIFKSSFQGKVDVGWNYSRISYIRGMWTSHARALAQRLGKPLPQSAVQITSGPRPEADADGQRYAEGEGEKFTAVVNVPQSKYQYTALQPPIIETPQLRDMGEATPPLEWIGLHRDRLPNLTHQIVIVSLLEVAKEVDSAYSRILGSS